ncbi:MAG TPA: sulfite exporter TauE/SafE family protein, partial [Gaiella sp.]|nr:sulfite exporter TauE/SafE family protein [Gaiella sp.]
MEWKLSLAGLLIGLLVGFTGMGGGSLMTPLLVLLFGVHPATAVGTDLLYASGTKAVGAMVHGSNRTVDWKVTGKLALGSVPATITTVLVLYWLKAHGQPAASFLS